MVSNGCRPGCDEANDRWPAGCQSCVSATCGNFSARRLINGTTSSPRGTASAPPGQKSFWTSTTRRRSVSVGVISLLTTSRLSSRPSAFRRESRDPSRPAAILFPTLGYLGPGSARSSEPSGMTIALLSAHDARRGSSPPHHGGDQVLDARCANLLHHGVKLDPQELEHALDAGLSECAE